MSSSPKERVATSSEPLTYKAVSIAWGAAAVVSAGVVWAAFCLWLAHDGRSPSVVLLPIARDRYYLVQAAFVTPLLVVLWILCSATASTAARAMDGRGSLATTSGAMGLALALPLLGLLLVPELILYGLAGFEALGAAVRLSAPASFIATLAAATRVVRVAHGLGVGKAFVAACAGVVAQALVGGILLR